MPLVFAVVSHYTNVIYALLSSAASVYTWRLVSTGCSVLMRLPLLFFLLLLIQSFVALLIILLNFQF